MLQLTNVGPGPRPRASSAAHLEGGKPQRSQCLVIHQPSVIQGLSSLGIDQGLIRYATGPAAGIPSRDVVLIHVATSIAKSVERSVVMSAFPDWPAGSSTNDHTSSQSRQMGFQRLFGCLVGQETGNLGKLSLAVDLGRSEIVLGLPEPAIRFLLIGILGPRSSGHQYPQTAFPWIVSNSSASRRAASRWRE